MKARILKSTIKYMKDLTFKLRSSLHFSQSSFQALISQMLKLCKKNCDDQSGLHNSKE